MVVSVIFAALSTVGSYTNLAENVISGVPIQLDRREVTISNSFEVAKYPLSIFPETEKRRIAADFGSTMLIPRGVMRAVESNEKAVARSQKRAEKGFCTKEESEAFVNRSRSALKTYLDRQVDGGVITPTERKLLGH